tara:strand:- start:1733 stop:2371 length:639 start_codon:yes stop_codon:yes gene_type:complete
MEEKRIMFKTHNPKINSYAQRNADNMTDVIMMVSLSIQQRWSGVGNMLSSVRIYKDNSLFLWGNKKRTYEYVITHKHFIHGSMLAVINSRNLTDHAKSISLMKIFLKVPGLNLVKAGFVCQLIAGLVGCMDIHNIKTYGVAAKSLEYNKNCKTSKGIENNRKKLIKYINLCHDYGTENLWDSWCSMLADKYPKDFIDGNHVSELHYTYLIGE